MIIMCISYDGYVCFVNGLVTDLRY